MIILGHALVPYEPLYLIKNGDEVFKYDNLLFKFNDRLIAAAQKAQKKFSVITNDINEILLANGAGARFDLDALDPGATYISALGVKPSSTALSYLLFTRVGGNAFAERDSDAFCPSGTIRAALGKYDTTVDVLGVTDLDLVEVGTTALIDDEIVRIDASAEIGRASCRERV